MSLLSLNYLLSVYRSAWQWPYFVRAYYGCTVTHVCIHKYRNICIYACTHMNIYIYVYMDLSIYIYICKYKRTYEYLSQPISLMRECNPYEQLSSINVIMWRNSAHKCSRHWLWLRLWRGARANISPFPLLLMPVLLMPLYTILLLLNE